MDITASVGKKGINHRVDVTIVQQALNRTIRIPYGLLKVDGLIGPATNAAIAKFQKEVLKFHRPDSLVEKGGKTWAALSAYLKEPTQQAENIVRQFLIRSSANGVCTPTISAQKIAWGAKVAAGFKNRVIQISRELNVCPDYLMACMAFETGETFSPSIENAAGSGAVGLIQFMPTTARALGTSTDSLKEMSAIQQLDYVKKYFLPHRYKLGKLEDVYMAILYPVAIGRATDDVLFKQGRKTYNQNKGFDSNKDGKITIGEISSKVRAKYEKGLKQGYLG